ncbi:MAG: hypothetical protein MUO77_14865 [Anaerolineales bacterium]|nr:hypothetical protein [Anaerolineales bacterium]
MVIETLSTLFSTLGTATSTAKVFKELIGNNRGDARILLEELKRNDTLCWLAADREVDAKKIIPQLSTKIYDQLLEKNFDLNKLSPKKKIITGNSRLQDKDLSSFIGKDIANLMESIYDRIKEMHLIYQVDPQNKRINWDRRVVNLHKRILLLMAHLKGWPK